VEGGAILEDLYRELFLGWGVTLPAGGCSTVGVGGHIAGGGYGVLSRELGLVVDYLHAVEVVTVGADGDPTVVRATSEPGDPNHDLWWAHTGGGGGTFGVVTRYWFRNDAPAHRPPESLLPQAPRRVLDFSCQWRWGKIDEARFVRLVRNHGEWCSRHSISGTANDRVHSDLVLNVRDSGHIRLAGQAHGAGADSLIDSLITEVAEGIGGPEELSRAWMPFLTSTRPGRPGGDQTRFKLKSAYRREPLTDRQVRTIYEYLTRPARPGLFAAVSQKSYGCRINDVAPQATAAATRDATMALTYTADWGSPADDAANDEWIRNLYQAVYRDSGGVPSEADGAYFGYADKDLKDPRLNRGAARHQLYFKRNYPRLQEVKARYDFNDIFRHGLSVRLPG
jgi:FAD/FMN-containing dehydrogenase